MGLSTPSSQPAAGATASLALDSRSLDALRHTAGRDPKAAIKETARQFEGLFMSELMKGMRKSVGSTGMLENAGSQLGTEMLDTQFATRMTGQPNGLGSVIARQLERQMGVSAGAGAAAAPAASAKSAMAAVVSPASAAGAGTALTGAAAGGGSSSSSPSSAAVAFAPAGAAGAPSGSAATAAASTGLAATRQADFVRTHTAAAKAVEAQTGIPANFMVAQAAHESGWGRREIKNADGSTSYNVFGIKAGASWTGPVATVTTTEYVDGAARKVTARFRAYASYEESFRDYAKVMTDSPRYAGVMAQVASAGSASGADVSTASAARFASGLQRAGYATDPAYADKLTRMINTTLRLQRAMT